jgi:sorting nexin-1/2
MVMKKKEQKARLEMGGRMDKLPMANEDVTEWENRLEETQANFAKISKVIKVEIDFFERYRVKDFKNSILLYLESLMECQVQMVNHWEEFLPEVKNSLY